MTVDPSTGRLGCLFAKIQSSPELVTRDLRGLVHHRAHRLLAMVAALGDLLPALCLRGVEPLFLATVERDLDAALVEGAEAFRPAGRLAGLSLLHCLVEPLVGHLSELVEVIGD